MSLRATKVGRLFVAGAASCMVLAACSNASTGTTGSASPTSSNGHTPEVSPGPGDTDGVTSNQISIGGLASATGPLANQFSPIWDGVQAYIDQVNAQGGVNGRRIVYTSKLDDQLLPSTDVSQARALVQSGVFAVVGVATPSFAGAQYLAQNDIPTFGWNINPDWSDGPSLFGDTGSYTDYTNPGPTIAWLAKKLGTTRVATVAYSVTQSAQCAQGQANMYNKYKSDGNFDLVLQDNSLPYGFTDITSDIQRLKSSGAQFFSTCLDTGGSVDFSKALHEASIYNSLKQEWPNGYDNTALAANQAQMQGVYFDTDGGVPSVKGYTKGMDAYLSAMNAHGYPISPETRAGWINADLFVTGLKMIGKDVSRSKLVNAINSMTHYTAGNINPGIDWQTAHHSAGQPICDSFVQVQGNKFAPVFGTSYGGKTNPFVCFSSINSPNLDTVPFPDPPSFFNG